MKYGVLGPKGTFSNIAFDNYKNNDDEVKFYDTIGNTFLGINECDRIIVPVENALDGYIGQSLDSIMDLNLKIVDEIYVPVEFSLLANCKMEEIEKVYVQFKAKGQCLNILSKLNKPLVITDSNIESLNLLNESNEHVAAIVPKHSYKDGYPFSILDVTDMKNNVTRFFVLDKKGRDISGVQKIFLCIKTLVDRPGLLYEILKYFKNENINLNAILSRPTKKEMGRYNFFIEITVNDKKIVENLISKIDIAQIILLGSYK